MTCIFSAVDVVDASRRMKTVSVMSAVIKRSVRLYVTEEVKNVKVDRHQEFIDVITCVQELTYADKIPCVRELAEHSRLRELHSQRIRAYLEKGMRLGMIERRLHPEHGCYYYAYKPAMKMWLQTQGRIYHLKAFLRRKMTRNVVNFLVTTGVVSIVAILTTLADALGFNPLDFAIIFGLGMVFGCALLRLLIWIDKLNLWGGE